MKKKYILLMICTISMITAMYYVKANDEYILNVGEYLHKTFDGKEGDHCSFRFKGYEIDGSGAFIRVYVHNNTAYEDIWYFSDSDYLYNWNYMFGMDSELKGGFDVPYESTWHVCFVNSGEMPMVFILTMWEITKPSDSTTIGMDLILFLLGFVGIGIILAYKRKKIQKNPSRY